MREWRADVRAGLAPAGLAPAEQAEVVEELAQHLEQQFAELSARVGAPEAERLLLSQLDDEGLIDTRLRRHARAPLPPVGRPATPGRWAETLWQDARYGVRSLIRSPALTAVAVASLAVGIGATTAIFSLFHSVLLERLAVRRPEQLI